MHIKVEGLDILEKRLKELGARMSQNLLRKALRAAMKPVVADAKQRAPVRTGRLRKSIKAIAGGKKGEAYIKMGFAKGAAYGIPLELGTSFFAARPMLRPSFDTKSNEAVAIFKGQLAEEIEKAAAV